MRFDFQLSSGFLVNQSPSEIPDLNTYEADWYAGAWLYYKGLQPNEEEHHTIRLGYANSPTPQSASDVKWIISAKTDAVFGGYPAQYATSMVSYSSSHSTVTPADDLYPYEDHQTYSIFSQGQGGCTSETSVGRYLESSETDYKCLQVFSLTHNYSCPSPNIYVSRDSIINIMKSGYVYLCISSDFVYYDEENLPAGQSYGNLTLLNQNGFGWIIKSTSFSDTFKVKEGERNWKGVGQSYVNVGEYDEDDNYIQTWKPIEQIKVKVGGVGTGSWKTLASTENVVIF